jgi:hypothetical protein
VYLLVFHAYTIEMHGSRRKIPSKNLVRQRCAERFKSGVKVFHVIPIHMFCVSVLTYSTILCNKSSFSQSQWPRHLRRGAVAVGLLVLRVRIPLGIWMSVSCECPVLSGEGLCVGLINHLEECGCV